MDRAGLGHELGLIERVVAPDEHQDGLGIRDKHQGLDLMPGRNSVRGSGEGFNGDHARGGKLLGRRSGGFRRGRFGGATADRLLDVGRVLARLAVNHVVLARLCRHHELVRVITTDDPGVGLNREGLQTATGEDAGVGVVHLVVARHRTGIGGIEGIGVLHEELLGAHQAETRADLIPELGLDLIEILRELAVGVQLVGSQRGDHLFVGGPENPILPGRIPHLEEHSGSRLVAAGLLPDIDGLQGGHEHLDAAGPVHFLADDLLDLAQDLQAERQERVQATGELPDQSCTQQELVGHDFCIRGGFLESRNERLGPKHGKVCGGVGSGGQWERKRPQGLPEGPMESVSAPVSEACSGKNQSEKITSPC